MQEALVDRLEFCGTENTWAITSDHMPIRITLNVDAAAQRTRRRYATQKLDQEKYSQEITNRLALIPEATLEDIQKTISKCLEEYCPKVRPSKHARREWSPEAAQLLAGTRRVKRQYSATGEAHHHQSYKALKNRLKQTIRKENRNSWCRFLEETSLNPTKPHN